MHNTTEIKKSLEDYPLIPMDEIEDEARLLAVRWVENYGTMGFDIQNKHKLASDITNYAIRHHETQYKEVERLTDEWISVKERKPANRTYVMVHSIDGYDIAEYKHGLFYIGLNTVPDASHWQPLPPPPNKA